MKLLTPSKVFVPVTASVRPRVVVTAPTTGDTAEAKELEN